MYNFIDDFLSKFEIGFLEPQKFIFDTDGLKDMYPTKWKKTEYGFRGTVKTLGIGKVDITVNDTGIIIEGKNDIDGVTYSTKIEQPIAKEILDNTTEIKKSTTNGITIIDIYVDRKNKRNIKISDNK